MSDLVGNPKDQFSHNEAHLYHKSFPTTCTLIQVWKLPLSNVHYVMDNCSGGLTRNSVDRLTTLKSLKALKQQIYQ